ncbi:class I SAM-dependent methyltransferase [Candidatus Bathyarchaeota archaeon]|nr:class I SAM-dependent methyltransferase [Candidatus Bathyarchaeota archaeon]
MNYRTVQGRTYHSSRGNAEYWGSNDEKQNDSLDLTHHAFTLALDGKLHLAPLKDNIQKVVDIGTGTGLWAIDFADEYPNCEVIGTDVSPIQPSWIPPNLKFEIDDCQLPWTFEPDSLDYVHVRYMSGCIQDWPALFRDAYRCTKPGGYIESFDSKAVWESDDGTVTEKSALSQWGKLFYEAGKVIGRTFDIITDDIQREGMEAAGFVVVGQEEIKVCAKCVFQGYSWLTLL